MKKILINIANKILSIFKAKVISTKHLHKDNFNDIFVADVPENKIVSVDNLSGLSGNIRGMISHRAGEELFSLVYMQDLLGDVAEIGSFRENPPFSWSSS